MSYHDEQESIESFKAWWTQWGNITTGILLVALLSAASWNGWNFWNRRQTAQAAVLYEQIDAAVASGDKAKIERIASDMEDRYGHTAYAQMSALRVAKALYEGGDAPAAKAQLQWVIDHAKDREYAEIARLRLASVLLDEKAYDAGLALLADTPSAAFKAIVADQRGDLLAAQGKRDEARAAYRLALDSLTKNDMPIRQLIQFKLDALGG